MMNFFSQTRRKIQNTFFSRSTHVLDITTPKNTNQIVQSIHAGINPEISEVAIREIGYAKEFAQRYVEALKPMGKVPGESAPSVIAYMMGHFNIETWGNSTLGLSKLSQHVDGLDIFGRFSHPLVQELAGVNHPYRQACAEIETISWYLQEIQKKFNI